ncbi:hypothetical protein [Blattabacterium cuenoti]|uniref:hypothetical protein n=1 Tax=Blattabacterium cuenoti TaxID=1653831 RepID=UPI00311F1A4F
MEISILLWMIILSFFLEAIQRVEIIGQSEKRKYFLCTKCYFKISRFVPKKIEVSKIFCIPL